MSTHGFQIIGEENRTILTVGTDGQIELGEGVEPSEAAQKMLEYLRQMMTPQPVSDYCQINGCVHKEHGFPTWPAGSNPFPPDPDLSSLRKGAEVVGEAAAYDFVAGWHERQAKLFREMADDDPRTAEPQRKRAFEAAIHHAASAAALRNRAADDRRAALVSGSREDGDG